MDTLVVSGHHSRLDTYLSVTCSVSRAKAQAWIRSGQVLVNEVPAKASMALSQGDLIQIDRPQSSSVQQPPPDVAPMLLHEDRHIIVLNKPVGMVVHPSDHDRSGTLSDGLRKYCLNLSTVSGDDRPGIVHRLDKDTEGVMVIAKDNDTHLALSEQFKTHQVGKHYYAMVKGRVASDHKHLHTRIGRHQRHRHRMAAYPVDSEHGKDAISDIYVRERFTTKTFVEVIPKTGRTHQIRVHLAYIGHPVLDDPVYGPDRKAPGQLLQAYRLCFTHPTKQKRLCFEVPLSERFFMTSL